MNYHWIQRHMYGQAPRENFSLKVDDIPGARPRFCSATKRVQHYKEKLLVDALEPKNQKLSYNETMFNIQDVFPRIQKLSQKRHFSLQNQTEISKYDIFKAPEQMDATLKRFDYPRSLWTKDIPGTWAGTLKSKVVKNAELADQIKSNRSAIIEKERLDKSILNYTECEDSFETNNKRRNLIKYDNVRRSQSQRDSKRGILKPTYVEQNLDHSAFNAPMTAEEGYLCEFLNAEKKENSNLEQEQTSRNIQFNPKDDGNVGKSKNPFSKLENYLDNNNQETVANQNSPGKRSVSFSPNRYHNSNILPPIKDHKINYHYLTPKPEAKFKIYGNSLEKSPLNNRSDVITKPHESFYDELQSSIKTKEGSAESSSPKLNAARNNKEDDIFKYVAELYPNISNIISMNVSKTEKSSAVSNVVEETPNNVELYSQDVQPLEKTANLETKQPERPKTPSLRENYLKNFGQDMRDIRPAGLTTNYDELLRKKISRMRKICVLDIISNQTKVKMIPWNCRNPSRYGIVVNDERTDDLLKEMS